MTTGAAGFGGAGAAAMGAGGGVGAGRAGGDSARAAANPINRSERHHRLLECVPCLSLKYRQELQRPVIFSPPACGRGRGWAVAVDWRPCRCGAPTPNPLPRAGGGKGSHVEPEQHHVAVMDDILLALLAQLARIARAAFTAQRDVIVIGDRLRADEAAFEIGVDFARRLRCARTGMDGPGARFLGADGEKGQQVEQLVPGA